MILINNTQRAIRVNETALKNDVQTILNALGYADYAIGILLTANKRMQNYNRDYRNKDKPTDILSFPYHTELKAGERIKPQSEDDKNLGDLIISLEYVKKDAPRWDMSFDERMQLLLVHGVCHLLGYDHEDDADYEIMQKKETELLNILKNKKRSPIV